MSRIKPSTAVPLTSKHRSLSNKVSIGELLKEANEKKSHGKETGKQNKLVEEVQLIVNDQDDDEFDEFDEYDDCLPYVLDGGCVPLQNREEGDQSGSSCDDIFHYFKRYVADVTMEHLLHFDFLTWRKTNEEEEVSKLYRKIVFKAQARERGDPAMLFYHVIKNDLHKLITKLDELEACMTDRSALSIIRHQT